MRSLLRLLAIALLTFGLASTVAMAETLNPSTQEIHQELRSERCKQAFRNWDRKPVGAFSVSRDGGDCGWSDGYRTVHEARALANEECSKLGPGCHVIAETGLATKPLSTGCKDAFQKWKAVEGQFKSFALSGDGQACGWSWDPYDRDKVHNQALYGCSKYRIGCHLLADVQPVAVVKDSQQESQLKRLAFVVGIDNYDHVVRLDRAVNDADAIGSVLSQLGFSVDIVKNPDRSELLAQFLRFRSHVEPEDIVVFYFAGHGVMVAGGNYLLPKDIPDVGSLDADLVAEDGIGVHDVIEWLQARNPQVSILIIDACRDAPFNGVRTRGIWKTRGLGRVSAAEGTFILYSAGFGQSALDGLDDHDHDPDSVFTRVLKKKLTEPHLELRSLARQVRQEVHQLTMAAVNYDQLPAYQDELLGDFYFEPEAPRRPQAQTNQSGVGAEEQIGQRPAGEKSVPDGGWAARISTNLTAQDAQDAMERFQQKYSGVARGFTATIKRVEVPWTGVRYRVFLPTKDWEEAKRLCSMLGYSGANCLVEEVPASVESDTASEGGWAARISTNLTAHDARDALEKFQQKYSGVARGFTATIGRVEVPWTGVRYRVFLPTKDREEAKRLCTMLSYSGAACLVEKMPPVGAEPAPAARSETSQPASRSGEERQASLGERSSVASEADNIAALLSPESQFARALLKHVRQHMFEPWPPNADHPTGAPKIAITIDKHGNFVGARVLTSSGTELLDQTALHQARWAAPYPEVPEGFSDESYTFFVTMRYGSDSVETSGTRDEPTSAPADIALPGAFVPVPTPRPAQTGTFQQGD